MSVMRERLSALGISGTRRRRRRPRRRSWIVARRRERADGHGGRGGRARGTSWSTATAYATGPYSGVAWEIELTRRRDCSESWWPPGSSRPASSPTVSRRLPTAAGIEMAEPLGSHRSVARTVLDRFDQAISARAAA